MRQWIVLRWLAALIVPLAHAPAWAAWPDDRPIELIVGFAPGGSTDVMARAIAPFIQKHLGGKAQMVIVNRPGASGELAVTQMQRAQPDGYTLAIVNLPGYFFLPMYRSTSYDPAQIALVARVVSDPTVLAARKDRGPHSLAEVIKALRTKEGSLSAGHNGVGTNGHLAMMRMQNAEKIQFNAIPYKGTAEQKVNLGGGHIDLAFVAASEVQTREAEAKPLELLAQFTPKRSPALQDVPTTYELGMKVEMTAERGFAMPRAVPQQIRERLTRAVEDAMRDPEYLKAARMDAPFLSFMSGPDWEKRIEQERKVYEPLAREVKP